MSQSTEEALWAAMRALEEKAGLLRRMAPRIGERLGAQYQEEAKAYDKNVETIRQILIDSQGLDRREQSTRSAA